VIRRRAVSITLALAGLVVTGTGLAWAQSITLSSQKLGASAVTTPAMFPVSVTLANKAGQTVGKVNSGDIITIVWSQPLNATTLCSGWSGTGGQGPSTFPWIITGNSTGNDVLTTSGTNGTCATGLHVGSIDLGATGYNTSTTAAIQFPTSSNTLSYSGTQSTLTVVLNGTTKGSPGTVSSGAPATWSCDSALTDRSARTCGSNLAQSSATVQF